MKKRMLSAILAMSMVMGMSSVTAFADDASFDDLDDVNGASFEATGVVIELPAINVTVPTSGDIVLDPFNMKQGGQVTSAEFKIINNSNVPISVTVKAAKAIGSTTLVDDNENGILDSTETDNENGEDKNGDDVAVEAPSIVAKAATDGSKWAVVNMNVTDGIGKTTKKVLSGTEQDIAVATAMAPKGGIVKYKYDGTTAVTPTVPWTEEDTLTISNTFAFTMNSYAVYNVAKAITCSMSEVSVTKGTTEATNVTSTFPATVIGDSKVEIPVTWKCVDNTTGADATYKADTAATYTFKAVVADADIYKIGGTATMPTITVTVTEPAAQG